MHYPFNLAIPTRRACGIHPYADPILGVGVLLSVREQKEGRRQVW